MAYVTDLKHMSHQCRLFSHLPGVYYVLRFSEPHWNVVSVSDQSESLLGYTFEELNRISSGFLQTIILPEDFLMVRDAKKTAFQKETLCELEFRIRTKGGSTKFVHDQYIVYADGDGWIMEGYLSEAFKTTIRDRLLHQLHSYREAIDVNMIASITDRKGKIVYANDNFCKISKYAAWELVGQNHRIVNSGHHSVEFFQDLWRTISSGQTWHGEILNRAKDGTVYWVDTVIIPIYDETKKIVNYLSLRILINERKKAEAERRGYIHLLEQIAFIVAHDVRAPLCRVLGLANLLDRYDNTPQESERALNLLLQSAQQLDEITRRLSTFVYENEIEMRLKDFDDK